MPRRSEHLWTGCEFPQPWPDRECDNEAVGLVWARGATVPMCAECWADRPGVPFAPAPDLEDDE